jgi:transposase InsO family protein
MLLSDGPNLRWSLDFVCGTRTCSRRFRILRLVDDYTRECLALVADTSLSGVRVARELTRLIGLRDKPHAVVSDSVLCREAAAGFCQQISICRQPSARHAF